MNLIKTSLLNAVAVAVKMITLLGINKVLAIYVGPSGYAAIGQFQNAVQMITTVASGAINTGVTKYTAEYHDDEKRQHAVWRTAGTISLTGSLIIGLLVIVFNKQLAAWFLNDENFGSVFIWFAVTLVFFIFNTLLLAILNGKKEIQRYVIANIAGSIFSLLITSVLTILYGLYGALVALAIYQSLNFIVTLTLTCKSRWFQLNYFLGGVDRASLNNLLKYTAMAITSAACVPVSHMLIRSHLGETLGWNYAGYWEAMWRLSAAYLMLVTTTLSVYYLPRLAEISTRKELRIEIFHVYKIILPIALCLSIIIYYFRDFIITILFTQSFSPMKDLFAWQLIGDSLKISSWIIAFIVTAKAMLTTYIFSEIFFSALFVTIIYLFTEKLGIKITAIAHAITYLLHLIFMIFILAKKKVI